MDAPVPTQTQVNIYLTFDGNCEEAINYYMSILGGKIVMKSTFGEGPMDVPESFKDRIMHIHYTFDGCSLMASDSSSEHPVNAGNNFHVSVYLYDKERATNSFNSLADGGQVTMPFQEVFWGGSFGSLVDKFGVQWMFSCP